MNLTAAVGGLVPCVAAGTVAVVRDHINLMGAVPPGLAIPRMACASRLSQRSGVLTMAAPGGRGGRPPRSTSRSPGGRLRRDARPALRTPAEVEMLARMGATVVGMSVVPESLPAHAPGLRVLGICSLTNAFGDHRHHEDVLRCR
mgnify:CR=1 FL=1